MEAPPWPDEGLAQRLWGWSQTQPQAPWALGPQGQALSWGEAARRAEGLALAWKLAPHELVALALPPGLDLALALWACWWAGALPHLVPSDWPPGARALRQAQLGPARWIDALPSPAPGRGAPPFPLGPEAPALLIATSGTSGPPALLLWSGQAMQWNALAHAQALGLPPGCRVMASGPWSAAFPMVAELLTPWLLGGAVVLPPGPFAPKGWLGHAQATGVHHLALAPPQWALARRLVPKPQGLPPCLSTGAMPVPPAELAALSAWAHGGGARLAFTYGLTEAGPRVATAWPDAGEGPWPLELLPGMEASLQGHPQAPPEAEGLLWLHSPSRALGRWEEGGPAAGRWRAWAEEPGAPAPKPGPGGWLATGDWARGAGPRALVLVGRHKSTILVGGASVRAEAVEEALLQVPGVQAACVVPTPHPSLGEAPLAFVEAGADFDPQGAMARLRGVLAREAWPLAIHPLAALPRLAHGKLDRQALRRWGEERRWP